jgi:hypothetical protein
MINLLPTPHIHQPQPQLNDHLDLQPGHVHEHNDNLTNSGSHTRPSAFKKLACNNGLALLPRHSSASNNCPDRHHQQTTYKLVANLQTSRPYSTITPDIANAEITSYREHESACSTDSSSLKLFVLRIIDISPLRHD